MPRPFHHATAEQVVLVCEAVVSLGTANDSAVSAFTDLPVSTAKNALKLATDMMLLSENNEAYSAGSPLCKLLRTPQDREKAAILRVALETYLPFLTFREEHDASDNVTVSAQRTKAKLDLDCHREEIMATILSLATYSGALTPGQGNSYSRDSDGLTALLDELVAGSRELADAIRTVRDEIGPDVELIDPAQVIAPLAAGLRHAVAGAGREAVLQAGIAVENFLASTADLHSVDVTSAHGINAKMQRITDAGHYPKKLLNASKYIGHVRNAADHGADSEISAPWDITKMTGRNYVFVSTSFIRSMLAHRSNRHEL